MTDLERKLQEILQIKNEKIIPENIKKDVEILGVIGTYEGSGGGTVEGIKQFSTIEEMQADTTAQEGALAVVYRSETQNTTVDSRFQVATFPDIVILDTAITDYVEVRYSAVDDSIMFDCMGQLDSSMFMMNCYTESGSVRIQYTSEDGITYTRTDTTGNPVDFGTEIYYEMAEYWNDAIGKFIQIDGSTFEGLFRYSDNSWLIASTQLSATANYVYEKEFYGANGIEIGVLGVNPSNTFADVNAKIGFSIQQQYENMEPRVLTDDDKTIDKNMYFIPVKKDGTVLLDTSNVTSMYYMFQYCTNLTEIPLLDTSKVTDMQRMFIGCTNLITIPELNTSSVTDTRGMFQYCTNLTEIPLLNTSSVTNMGNMFSKCTSLSDASLNNILAMCTNATSYTSTKTLKYIGLSEEQATRCQSLSNYQACINAGWTTGY